ncbi:low-specificity D-threonine aldolase [Pseudoalteromonas luteoviolacea B = ATCC 29581]|nr:low-specificity D-threonine aldolase [Pseudoalteromonas luteoviolacea B = ATCC 29581]
MTELLKGSGCPQQLQNTGWDILQEQVSLPVAVIHKPTIMQNAKWMADFASKYHARLAPHGKTTMSVDLFRLQLELGAWGITLATIPQVSCALDAGITRVIMANQLVGAYHFEQVAHWLATTPVEFYCFADSLDNLNALSAFFSKKNQAINVLLEVGVKGGRCGLRSKDELTRLVATCQQYDSLNLMGLAFYEGVILGQDPATKVAEFVAEVMEFAVGLREGGQFHCENPIISGAGSAWYDIVSDGLASHPQAKKFTIVLRPGCYLTHDSGIYRDAQLNVLARSCVASSIHGELKSGLSVWAYVLSLPEPGLAIIGMGKRDVSYDAGFPQAELHYSPRKKQLNPIEKNYQIEKIMDQHCMLRYPSEGKLQVGDMINFSTSHPCLTFDKWRQIGIVEREWVICKTLTTQF